jgi:hypothetical protein
MSTITPAKISPAALANNGLKTTEDKGTKMIKSQLLSGIPFYCANDVLRHGMAEYYKRKKWIQRRTHKLHKIEREYWGTRAAFGDLLTQKMVDEADRQRSEEEKKLESKVSEFIVPKEEKLPSFYPENQQPTVIAIPVPGTIVTVPKPDVKTDLMVPATSVNTPANTPNPPAAEPSKTSEPSPLNLQEPIRDAQREPHGFVAGKIAKFESIIGKEQPSNLGTVPKFGSLFNDP